MLRTSLDDAYSKRKPERTGYKVQTAYGKQQRNSSWAASKSQQPAKRESKRPKESECSAITGPRESDCPASKRRRGEDGSKLQAATKSTCSVHRFFTQSCAQCVFRKHKHDWVRGHGAVRTRRNNSVVLECWLQERLKPKWSLGCAACAQLLARASLAKENSARHLRRRFSTKWARFEITALSQMQSCSFAQHAATSVHKLAVKSLREPDLPLVALLPECEDDTSLLRGCVPQPEDFLKAWRCVKSPVSFSKASMQSHTDFFITGHQRAEGGIERRLLLPDSVSHVVCMCSLFVGSVILENSPRTL